MKKSNSRATGYSGVDNLELMLLAKNYNNFLLREVARTGQNCSSAVDLGAGIGNFALKMREAGFSVICVEADKALSKRLCGYGFKVFSDLTKLQSESVDYIYSLNVLEHIEDDSRILKTIYSKLRPGGKLLIYVPAFTILFSAMDRKVGHCRRYEKNAATRLLESAGFQVERSVYIDSLGFLVTLIFKIIGNCSGDLTAGSIKFFDTMIFPLSRLCDRVLGRVLGKNLLIVANKPANEDKVN